MWLIASLSTWTMLLLTSMLNIWMSVFYWYWLVSVLLSSSSSLLLLLQLMLFIFISQLHFFFALWFILWCYKMNHDVYTLYIPTGIWSGVKKIVEKMHHDACYRMYVYRIEESRLNGAILILLFFSLFIWFNWMRCIKSTLWNRYEFMFGFNYFDWKVFLEI